MKVGVFYFCTEMVLLIKKRDNPAIKFYTGLVVWPYSQN
jgi:hypothetical protein